VRARAKASEKTIDLSVVFEVIKTLEAAQKELNRSLFDVKRVQENQSDSTDLLQLVTMSALINASSLYFIYIISVRGLRSYNCSIVVHSIRWQSYARSFC
jgi:hypothetical protein